VTAPAVRLARGPLISLLMASGFLALCVATLSGDWRSFFSVEAMAKMGEFALAFAAPARDMVFLGKLGVAALETLAISFLGTLLAAVGGLALALPAAGRWERAARGLSRLLLNVLRSIPELVWAALTVIAAGLGPFSGTLALALHTTGVLGRLFAESLENVPPEPQASLRHHGVPPMVVFWYAAFPQALPQLMSYSLYRLEINIRAAAVLGVVGAGGLGQMLHFHLSLFQFPEAASVLIGMIVLVTIVDAISNRVRDRLTL
jgi:phosphonate transport system permease protein